MGVIRTDRLLDEFFFAPEKICAKISRRTLQQGTDLYSFLGGERNVQAECIHPGDIFVFKRSKNLGIRCGTF